MPLGLLAGAFLLAWLLSAPLITSPNLHTDERGWLASGLVYCDLIAQGDFTPSHWDQQGALWSFGNLNPHLGKVMLTFPAYRFAKRMEIEYKPQEHFTSRDRMGIFSDTLPPPPAKLLRLARRTAFFWACCTAGVMIAAAWWMAGRVAAVLFGYTILLNRFFLESASMAMTDFPYLFFLGLGMLCGIWLVRAATSRQRTLAVVLGFLAAGLATSVKVTGLPILGLYFTVLLLYLAGLHRVRLRGALGRLALGSAVALLPIYGLNPFLWPEWSSVDFDAAAKEWEAINAGEILYAKDEEFNTLWESLRQSDVNASAVRRACPNLANMLRPLEFPLLYPRWSHLFEALARQYPVNEPLEALYGSIFRHASSVFEVMFLFFGLYVAWLRVRLARDESSPLVAGMAYLAVQALFLLMMLPVKGFERYYLPAILISRVFVALGVAEALEYPRLLVVDLHGKHGQSSASITPKAE